MTVETALLAVAGGTGADVALGGQGMARRARRGDDGAARVARPAGRVEALEPGPGAERVVGPPPRHAPLRIGGDPRALVAADAERLCAMASRAVGRVAA